jgi:pyridoxine kinase
MARILAISSYVAHGHVGLGAGVPALNRLGHEVVALPTVILSNHPGHPRWAGERVDPGCLASMLDALDANGILGGVHAVLTGYLPSPAHVRFAAKAAARVAERQPRVEVFVDPVLGDDPAGLYVDDAAAAALRDELVPLADMIFPNRFELSYLTGLAVDDVASAIEAAQEARVRSVLATSIPSEPGHLANLFVVGGDAARCDVPRLEFVPHGTGDLLAALFVGHRLNGGRGSVHLGAAVAGVAAAVALSRGSTELRLIPAVAQWAEPVPLAVTQVSW